MSVSFRRSLTALGLVPGAAVWAREPTSALFNGTEPVAPFASVSDPGSLSPADLARALRHIRALHANAPMVIGTSRIWDEIVAAAEEEESP